MAGLRILFDTPKHLPKQIVEARKRERWLTCWSISILLHVSLFLFGTVWLIRSAHFHVMAGKTSTEISLILEPVPVPVIKPSPPTPIPSPSVQPSQASEPIKTQIKPLPEPDVTAASAPAIVQAKPRAVKPPAVHNKASSTNEASNAAKGAVQAEPDDLHNEPPEYPEESRAAREQGIVILRVEVTSAGEPATVSILKSSGYFRLDQAARQAVQHWKFGPAMAAGIPVASEIDVPVRFRLQ